MERNEEMNVTNEEKVVEEFNNHEGMIQCAECGEWFNEEEMTRTQSFEWVCRDCLEVGYTQCADCEEWVANEDVIDVDFGYPKGRQPVCNHCINNDSDYIECCDCGEYFYKDNCYYVENHGWICMDCREGGEYEYCEDCGGLFCADDTYWNSHDECYYCCNCVDYHSDDDGVIHCYHEDHDIFFYNSDGTQTWKENEGELYLGCEIEVDTPSGERCEVEDIASEVQDNFGDFVTLQQDGSLNSGFEIITQPATIEVHKEKLKNEYKNAFDVIRDGGMRSHDTKTCGLHVHFNRKFFGEKDSEEEEICITRLLYLVEKFWDELVLFSRRKQEQLNHWAGKYDKKPEDVVKDMKNHDLSRYRAINLTNRETIEWRMFRGTINRKTFLATLQLVERFCRLAKDTDITIEKLQEMKWEDMLVTEELKEYSLSRNIHINTNEVEGGNN